MGPPPKARQGNLYPPLNTQRIKGVKEETFKMKEGGRRHPADSNEGKFLGRAESENCLTDTSSKRLWVKIKKENHLSEDPRRRGLNHGSLLRKRTPEKQICSQSFDPKLLWSSKRWNPKTKSSPKGEKQEEKRNKNYSP